MMMLDAIPPPGGVTPGGGRPARPAAPIWQGDEAVLALALYAVWATRTGRTLRPVPVTELTPAELVEFWADDQMEEPLPGGGPGPQ